MIKVKGHCKINGNSKFDYEVELDLDSFEDIEEDKMPLEKSDELIRNAIYEKYGMNDAKNIFVDYSD